MMNIEIDEEITRILKVYKWFDKMPFSDLLILGEGFIV